MTYANVHISAADDAPIYVVLQFLYFLTHSRLQDNSTPPGSHPQPWECTPSLAHGHGLIWRCQFSSQLLHTPLWSTLVSVENPDWWCKKKNNPQTSHSQKNSALSASAANIPQTVTLRDTDKRGLVALGVPIFFFVRMHICLFLVELFSTTRCDFVVYLQFNLFLFQRKED